MIRFSLILKLIFTTYTGKYVELVTLHIRIVAVGRMKEPFYHLAQDEYKKRLQRYTKLAVVEVADEPIPRGAQERLAVTQREGERLLERVLPGSLIVAMDPRGQEFTSETFAAWIRRQIDTGRGEFSFLLGGTLGLSSAVLPGADLRFSLSRLTFPHQLARLVLLEQLYRAFRIIRREPYHY